MLLLLARLLRVLLSSLCACARLMIGAVRCFVAIAIERWRRCRRRRRGRANARVALRSVVAVRVGVVVVVSS